MRLTWFKSKLVTLQYKILTLGSGIVMIVTLLGDVWPWKFSIFFKSEILNISLVIKSRIQLHFSLWKQKLPFLNFHNETCPNDYLTGHLESSIKIEKKLSLKNTFFLNESYTIQIQINSYFSEVIRHWLSKDQKNKMFEYKIQTLGNVWPWKFLLIFSKLKS